MFKFWTCGTEIKKKIIVGLELNIFAASAVVFVVAAVYGDDDDDDDDAGISCS